MNEGGRYYQYFSIIYELTHIVYQPTCISDSAGHHANLFLTSYPESCSAEVLTPYASFNDKYYTKDFPQCAIS